MNGKFWNELCYLGQCSWGKWTIHERKRTALNEICVAYNWQLERDYEISKKFQFQYIFLGTCVLFSNSFDAFEERSPLTGIRIIHEKTRKKQKDTRSYKNRIHSRFRETVKQHNIIGHIQLPPVIKKKLKYKMCCCTSETYTHTRAYA